MMNPKHLHILWTSQDPITAQTMVLHYATNSLLHDFWEQVTVILWGGAAKLAAEDERIQERMAMASHAGVRFQVCVSCARTLGAEDTLSGLGVEVLPMGQALTDLIQSGAPLLTV
jgi:hypothetical protein